MIEKWIIIALIFLEYFVKKPLCKLFCLPYHLYIKYGYWKHNREVERYNRYYELNPPKLPNDD